MDRADARSRTERGPNHRRVSDEELDSIIASLDVAVIAHSNDGPSGIMGKADLAGSAF